MSKAYIISVTGHDRVGIVAEVSALISQLSGNLEDLSQTVMRNYFSMILLAIFPDSISRAKFKKVWQQSGLQQNLELAIFPFQRRAEKDLAVEAENLYILTASGADRNGLVATVAEALRERKINIVDLSSRQHQGEYTMMMQLCLPKKADVSKLKKQLQAQAQIAGLQLELRHQALFRKTNEI